MNENVIITGANGGIGKNMVQIFASHGYNVWACYRNLSIEFSSFIEAISQQYQVKVTPIKLDLNDNESIRNGLNLIFDEKKPIDVLVNNAGTYSIGLLNQTKIEDIRKVFETNFFGTLRVIQLVSKKMALKRKGCIINIASLAGIEPQPGKVGYGCSKAALIMATKCLAKELGPLGIRVNAIAPGPIETEMIKQYDEDMRRRLVSDSALRRLGAPIEIAQTALFLASEQASYINGDIIRVDGGR